MRRRSAFHSFLVILSLLLIFPRPPALLPVLTSSRNFCGRARAPTLATRNGHAESQNFLFSHLILLNLDNYIISHKLRFVKRKNKNFCDFFEENYYTKQGKLLNKEARQRRWLAGLTRSARHGGKSSGKTILLQDIPPQRPSEEWSLAKTISQYFDDLPVFASAP